MRVARLGTPLMTRVERRWTKGRGLGRRFDGHVYWTMSRRSVRQVFVNGRTRVPEGEVLIETVWHVGTAWSWRGARAQMLAIMLDAPDDVRVIDV
jgi:hypothetical protein